jgi:hypothetical protein
MRPDAHDIADIADTAGAAAGSVIGPAASRPTRVRSPELEVLWPSVMDALDHELQNLQRSGDNSRSPRYDALAELRRGLGAPGRSA